MKNRSILIKETTKEKRILIMSHTSIYFKDKQMTAFTPDIADRNEAL